MSQQLWWVNGVKGAFMDPTDPGFSRGLTAFETMRTYQGHLFRLEAHLDRLRHSVETMKLPKVDDTLAEELILAAHSARGFFGEDVWVRVNITYKSQKVVVAAPVDQAKIARPVIVDSLPLTPPTWLPGSVKHCSRASWSLAASGLGCDEVIFIDADGHILEANRSNVVAVVEGTLWTPPADGRILNGVTRRSLIDVAADINLPFIEAPLPLETPFDELYLCSTLKELAPVKRLDGVVIGGGPVGLRLHRAFRSLTAQASP